MIHAVLISEGFFIQPSVQDNNNRVEANIAAPSLPLFIIRIGVIVERVGKLGLLSSFNILIDRGQYTSRFRGSPRLIGRFLCSIILMLTGIGRRPMIMRCSRWRSLRRRLLGFQVDKSFGL